MLLKMDIYYSMVFTTVSVLRMGNTANRKVNYLTTVHGNWLLFITPTLYAVPGGLLMPLQYLLNYCRDSC